MFEKSSVTKVNANPLFATLIASTGSAPHWNFHKYVVDRTGTRVASFADRIEPDARDLVASSSACSPRRSRTAKI